MSWQDILLTIVTAGFIYALIPQIKDTINYKRVGINNQTLIITFIGLYTSCIVYGSLYYWISFAMTLTTASLWLTLFILKLKYKQ